MEMLLNTGSYGTVTVRVGSEIRMPQALAAGSPIMAVPITRKPSLA